MYEDRLPPQSIENERAVLGACLYAPECADLVADILIPSDFYKTAHRKIYGAIEGLSRAGSQADIITVIEALRKNGDLEDVGGAAYIVELHRCVVSTGNLAAYAGVIKDKAIMRILITSYTEIVRRAFDETEDSDKLLASAENVIFEITERRLAKQAGVSKFADVSLEAVQRIERRMKTQEIPGIPMGFRDLDVLTSGLHAGDLITIAARTSAGKSSLARQIATNVAKAGKTTMIFSLEMNVQLMTELILCTEAEVDRYRIQAGLEKNGPGQVQKLVYAAQKLEGTNIYLDSSANRIDQVCVRSRLHARRHGLDLVIIDYLQLIEGEKGQSREREVASVSRSLKLLATELDIPVIALSQFNRRVDHRQGSPRLSDLRESGAIEQDSDVVIFIERIDLKKEPEARGNARLTVKKQRSGPLGEIPLTFRKEYTRFENAAKGRTDEG